MAGSGDGTIRAKISRVLMLVTARHAVETMSKLAVLGRLRVRVLLLTLVSRVSAFDI
jgi:hypothetical protein